MSYLSLRLILLFPFVIILSSCTSKTAEQSSPEQSPQVIAANEAAAMARLRSIANGEAQYLAESSDSYATLDELIKKGLATDPMRGKLTGYRFEVRVKPGGFEATAEPVQPGISGRRSFYIDETNVLRGAERRGAKATSTDQEV